MSTVQSMSIKGVTGAVSGYILNFYIIQISAFKTNVIKYVGRWAVRGVSRR